MSSVTGGFFVAPTTAQAAALRFIQRTYEQETREAVDLMAAKVRRFSHPDEIDLNDLGEGLLRFFQARMPDIDCLRMVRVELLPAKSIATLVSETAEGLIHYIAGGAGRAANTLLNLAIPEKGVHEAASWVRPLVNAWSEAQEAMLEKWLFWACEGFCGAPHPTWGAPDEVLSAAFFTRSDETACTDTARALEKLKAFFQEVTREAVESVIGSALLHYALAAASSLRSAEHAERTADAPCRQSARTATGDPHVQNSFTQPRDPDLKAAVAAAQAAYPGKSQNWALQHLSQQPGKYHGQQPRHLKRGLYADKKNV